MSMQNSPFSSMSADSGGAPVCRRCGTCCLLGGPTLMLSDAALLVSGTLTLESLVCLRAGEWARDDARKALRPLEGERIKIAGPGGRVHPWRCRYYREGAGCGIYDQRPAQCTALFCMDTGPLETLLAKASHLGRYAALDALAGGIPGFSSLSASSRALLPDLVSAHEEQVSVRAVLELADRLGFFPQQGQGLTVERYAEQGPHRRGFSRALRGARWSSPCHAGLFVRQVGQGSAGRGGPQACFGQLAQGAGDYPLRPGPEHFTGKKTLGLWPACG